MLTNKVHTALHVAPASEQELNTLNGFADETFVYMQAPYPVSMTVGDSTSPSGEPLSSSRHSEPVLMYIPADNHIPSTCSLTTHGLSY